MKKYQTLYLAGIISEDVYYEALELDQNGLLNEGWYDNIKKGVLGTAAALALATGGGGVRAQDSRSQVDAITGQIDTQEKNQQYYEELANNLINDHLSTALRKSKLSFDELKNILKNFNFSVKLLKAKNQYYKNQYLRDDYEFAKKKLLNDDLVKLILQAHPNLQNVIEKGGVDWQDTTLPNLKYDYDSRMELGRTSQAFPN